MSIYDLIANCNTEIYLLLQNKWFTPLFSDSLPQKTLEETVPVLKKSKTTDDSFEFIEPVPLVPIVKKLVKPTGTNTYFEASNWLDNLSPKTVDDLAIHTKKIEEIRNFFKNYEDQNFGHSAFMLISGPPGSAKYTSIKLLVKEAGYTITEWINQVDVEMLDDRYDFDETNTENFYRYNNQKDLFDDFLYKTSRYCSLFEDCDKRVLIVKDYPNNFLLDPQIFHSSLE